MNGWMVKDVSEVNTRFELTIMSKTEGPTALYGCGPEPGNEAVLRLVSQFRELTGKDDDLFLLKCESFKGTKAEERSEWMESRKKLQALQMGEMDASLESGLMPALDAGINEDENFCWQVYPVARHGSLLDCLKKHRDELPSLDDLIEQVIKQIGPALMCLHRNGFYHRDVKAENIFVWSLAGAIELKLGDFDIAKAGTPRSTLTYFGPGVRRAWNTPPDSEMNEKGDAFTLGMTLLQISALRNQYTESPFWTAFSKPPGDPLKAEALKTIDEAVENSPKCFLRQLAQLPQRFQSLTGRLLAKDNASRGSIEDALKQVRGEMPPWSLAEIFPKYVGWPLREEEEMKSLCSPSMLVSWALSQGGGERVKFFDYFLLHFFHWLRDYGFDQGGGDATSRHYRRIEGLQKQFQQVGASDDQKERVFFQACCLVDPTCALPCHSFPKRPQTLGELSRGFHQATQEQYRELSGMLRPLQSATGASDDDEISILEIWIEATQVHRAYWQDFISQDCDAANEMLKTLSTLRRSADKLSNTNRDEEGIMLLRLTALDVAFQVFEHHSEGKGESDKAYPWVLHIRNMGELIQWHGLPKEDALRITNAFDLCMLLSRNRKLGDHLRRSGVLQLWLSIYPKPEVRRIGEQVDFFNPRHDELLTLLLAWDIKSLPEANVEEAVWDGPFKAALSEVFAQAQGVPWEQWVDDFEGLEKIKASCHEYSHARRFYLEKLLSMHARARPLSLKMMIPLPGGEGDSTIQVGRLMVCLAKDESQNLSFCDSLSLLFPGTRQAWWNGLANASDIGLWMLQSDNYTLADRVRRSGIMQAWVACEEEQSHRLNLFDSAWTKDQGEQNAELTTRFGVLLAGKGGPVAKLIYDSADEDRLSSGEVVKMPDMPTEARTRWERFDLRNVAGELPGILCCKVFIKEKGGIFGDPAEKGEDSEFRQIRQPLYLHGNQRSFQIPVNTTVGVVQGSAEKATLILEYNEFGKAEWKRHEIPLECAVSINHGRILRLYGTRSALAGMTVFGFMGWFLTRLVPAWVVNEPGVKSESGAQHWWRRWLERPEENLHAWGGAIEPNAQPVVGYLGQATWGMAFLGFLLVTVLMAIWPRAKPTRDG